jgi:hypothetical protein
MPHPRTCFQARCIVLDHISLSRSWCQGLSLYRPDIQFGQSYFAHAAIVGISMYVMYSRPRYTCLPGDEARMLHEHAEVVDGIGLPAREFDKLPTRTAMQ